MKRLRIPHWLELTLAGAILVASTTISGATFAEGVPINSATDDQKEAATTHYVEAKEAFTAGRFEDALTGFRTSHNTVASPNARYMIVACLSELGRDVEGYQEAEEGIQEATAAAQTDEKYQKTLSDLTDAKEKLRAKIGLLTLVIPADAAPNAMLTLDGVDVPSSAWGDPIPVTAGTHRLTLNGFGTKETSVAAGGNATVDFNPEEPEPVVDVTEEESSDWFRENRRIIAYSAGGVGVAGFALFGIFGGLALSKQSDLDDTCNLAKQCPTASQADIDDGQTFQTVANVMLVVGSVGVAAGVGLFVWDLMDEPSDDEGDGDTMAPLRLEIGPGNMMIRGSF